MSATSRIDAGLLSTVPVADAQARSVVGGAGLSQLFLQSTSARPRLRIGLLVDGDQLPRHFAAVVRDIQASNFARIELVVVNGEAPRAPRPERPDRLGLLLRYARQPALRAGLAYRLYQRFERDGGDDDPETLVGCGEAFKGIPTLSTVPIRKNFVHRIPAADLERIRAADLDVLLRFGFNILRGEILDAARFGVWSYHHGDNDRFRGGPPCMWELMENADSTGVVLQRLSEELDAGLVLCKSTFRTSPSLSVRENRYLPYWGGVHFVIRKLHELHEHGWEWVASRAVPRAPYQGRERIYRAPDNAAMGRWLAPAVARKVVRPLQRQGTETRWSIGLRVGSRTRLIDGSGMAGFKLVEPPRGHYWADPMLIEREGRTWLFFEDYVRREDRGVIRVAEVDKGGAVGPSEVCLEARSHLSYPHLVTDEGELFMIPESCGDREVVLYRCERFPNRWKRERVLLRGLRAVDTTVVQHEGRWWMFTAAGERAGGEVELLLYYADSLFGPFTLHPMSPICSSVSLSRCAGALVRRGSRLFRPSQRCAPRYGHALVFNEVLTLDPREYREQPVRLIEPDWRPNLIGTHTYSVAGEIEAVDACDLVPPTLA